MKITLAMSEQAYGVAKKVYFGQLSRSEGKVEINKRTGMNSGSAQAFITIFLAMMDGNEYKRAFNNATNQFLLESIRRDFGEEALQKALAAAQKHVNYYATLNKGNLTGLQEIIDRFNERVQVQK